MDVDVYLGYTVGVGGGLINSIVTTVRHVGGDGIMRVRCISLCTLSSMAVRHFMISGWMAVRHVAVPGSPMAVRCIGVITSTMVVRCRVVPSAKWMCMSSKISF